jgi:hypothetical protein
LLERYWTWLTGLLAGGSYSDVVLDENLTNDTWSTVAPPIPPGWSNGTGPLSAGPETIADDGFAARLLTSAEPGTAGSRVVLAEAARDALRAAGL